MPCRTCQAISACTYFYHFLKIDSLPICFFLFSSSQDSIKWLPKSPKWYSGHNWSSQGSRWASLKGKEGFHGGSLYKFSSSNGKWREGRISPEQEAEELEDPDEDVGSFLGVREGQCCVSGKKLQPARSAVLLSTLGEQEAALPVLSHPSFCRGFRITFSVLFLYFACN